MTRPPFTPAAGEKCRVASGPVIAAGLVVDLRLAAELADREHQRRREQAALGEIAEECRERLVEPRRVAVLHDLEVAVVVVPAAVARVLFGLDVIAPVHLHERHAGLDESPGEQARLAEARAAVAIDRRGLLLREIERGRGRRRCEHFERAQPVLVELARLRELRGSTLGLTERGEQLLPVGQALRREVFRQLQRRNLRSLGRVVLEPERVARGAERPAALADDRLLPLVQLPADDEERVNRLATRLGGDGLSDDRTERRSRRAGQRLAVETGAAGAAAGQADRAGDAVVVRLRGERADDRELVGQLREFREEFAESDAGDLRRDRAERPAVFERSVRLRIERVELARPAPQPQEDDGLRPAERGV